MSLHRPIVTAALLAAFLNAPLKAELAKDLVAYWNFEGAPTNKAPAAIGSGFDGKLIGGALLATDARAGSGSLGLDGVYGYMNVSRNVDTSKAWTISAWFKTAASSIAKRQGVYESGDNFAMSFGLRESLTTPGKVNAQISTNAKTAKYLLSNQETAWEGFSGVWHHIVEIHTPSTATAKGSIVAYLDGKRSPVITLAQGDAPLIAEGLRIGTYRTADGRWFHGVIDEVALWNRSLSEVEAAQLFQLGGEGKPVVEVTENHEPGVVTGTSSETAHSAPGSKLGIVIAGVVVLLASGAGAAFAVVRKKRVQSVVNPPAYLPPPPGH